MLAVKELCKGTVMLWSHSTAHLRVWGELGVIGQHGRLVEPERELSSELCMGDASVRHPNTSA